MLRSSAKTDVNLINKIKKGLKKDLFMYHLLRKSYPK